MVARRDLRPTRPGDSIKSLRNKLANPQTTPHGVKVAQPGEYVSFYDTTGVSHRWDGDAIAEYDTRIAEGAAAVAAAQAHLAEVEADLAEAKERISASNGDLTLYVERVEAAQAAADTANAALQSLTSELETAQSAVDAVTARTGAVESAVVEADTKAAQAASDANAASNAAQNALAAAQQVQADAQNALSKAEEAEAKALETAGIAAGKGKIIHAAHEPTGAEASSNNLWIRSADSKPHRWDGTRWVEITDKAIVDAAQAAANAQATADKAVADAAAAASAAQSANIAAGNAQRTADGKTVALFGTATPPPAPGVTQGDLYYRTGTDNRIIEQWQWSGSAWVKRAIESAQLVNFDAGYITSGFLDVAKRIRAGAILADKLTVGIGDNLIPNGNGQAKEGWTVFGWNNGGPDTNGGYPGSFWVQGRKTLTSDKLPATPGDYRFSVAVKGEADGQRFYVQVIGYNSAGTRINPAPYPVVNQNVPNGEWQTFTGNITLPGGITQAAIAVYSMHPNGTQDETKYIWYTGLSLRELKDGSLIVNGSITGEKVNAESVAAAVGSFVKVNAENVAVTGELAARVVNAMTAQVKNLVVTESSILQHTTLLGETVAEELNVTKKLVARDAIVNGTLDVEQLNVTGDMAAQIVSAMSVASKKLIVTEEAILNRATVVQSLVTPELIADRINVNTLGSQLVTSGAIQTDPAANRGVKITNAGVNAWDSNGVQTIRLNGADNLLTGSFQTADDSIGRIRIFNQKDPVNHSQNGFITFHAIGGTKASHGVLAYTSNQLTLSVREGNADGTMKPFSAGLSVNPEGALLQGNLFLSGQFSKDGAIAAYSLSGGTIPAGGYVSFTQPISLTNGQRPWAVVQPASSNYANLSPVTWTTNNLIKGRVYNNSNFAAINVWIDVLTFAIER